MFAPSVGIPEDAATGSAAVCLAGAIHHFDRLPDGTHRRVIEQGIEMGRPSSISLTLVVDRGQLVTVRIGGSAVLVYEGDASRFDGSAALTAIRTARARTAWCGASSRRSGSPNL